MTFSTGGHTLVKMFEINCILFARQVGFQVRRKRQPGKSERAARR